MKKYTMARASRRQGFTLMEVLVALGIFMMMLAILFVPLNMSFNFFHIGSARVQVQQAAQMTLNQIETELRLAIHVYPNDEVPDVTDKAPYTDNDQRPYRQSRDQEVLYTDTLNPIVNFCATADHFPAGNPSRIDILLPKLNDIKQPDYPVTSGPFIVTYYARRLYVDRDYDFIDNPIVLFRAQLPYQCNDGNSFLSDFTCGNAPNLHMATGNERYNRNEDAEVTSPYKPAGRCHSSRAPETNRASLWLLQNMNGEPNLEGLAKKDATGVVADHSVITPRGMSLTALNALPPDPEPPGWVASYIPDTSFVCTDSNRDGKIDRVRISLSLAQYDEGGPGRDAQPSRQQVRLSQEVDLPNVK